MENKINGDNFLVTFYDVNTFFSKKVSDKLKEVWNSLNNNVSYQNDSSMITTTDVFRDNDTLGKYNAKGKLFYEKQYEYVHPIYMEWIKYLQNVFMKQCSEPWMMQEVSKQIENIKNNDMRLKCGSRDNQPLLKENINIQQILRETINNYIFNDNIISAGSYIFCKNEMNEWCILGGKRGASAPSCPNMYNIPVGMREEGETAQECAQRECYEETNLNIPLSKFKFVNKEEWAKGKVGANYIVILDGNIHNYNIGLGDGENDKFKWIPMTQINKVPWAYNMDKTVMKMYTYIKKD